MTIILVSEDQELRRTCREVLTEIATEEWQLTTSTADDCPSNADLYIWDDHGRIAPPAHLDQTWSKHLFAVRPEDLVGCGKTREEISAAVILLKPVTRACLSAFLQMALSVHERGGAANSLRAQRDEVLQCLIQANLRIQKHDQDRTNFLARVVHDLRAPLMTASGYCGLLLSDALGAQTERQKEVLRRMKHSMERLSRMTSALFEVSIGKQVKRAPELRRANIRDCAEQALHEIAPFADDKRISISIDLQSESGALHMDPGQIEQVLVNLLENACKFTPKTGEIEIRGYPHFWERRCNGVAPSPVERRSRPSREPNSYRIDIRDSGSHIPQEHLTKIFEEYTSYNGMADRSGGGLGLAICRMILNAHGGRIWAENSDSGPRFSFVLPIRRAEPAVAGAGALPFSAADRAQL